MNQITGIVVGQYGEPILLQVLDDVGVGIDLSVYTGLSILAASPNERTTLTFSSTGGDTSGNFGFTPTSGNTFDEDGTWLAQVQLTTASILAMTIPFEIIVERQI